MAHYTHPLLIFLPALPRSSKNSAARVADLLAVHASISSRGTYTAADLESPYPTLQRGRQVCAPTGDPAFDVLELDYRPELALPAIAGVGVAAALRRFLLSLRSLLWAAAAVRGGHHRAKSSKARASVLLAAAVLPVLFVSVVVTIITVLTSLGVVFQPVVSATFTEAIALGLTATVTYLLARVQPHVRNASLIVEQLMEYVGQERHGDGVAQLLGVAIDDVLDADPERPLCLVGYSLGSLVALDFLFPRTSLPSIVDARLHRAVIGFFSIGCPVDFVRLYFPSYLGERTARIPDLNWQNVYIPADIFASNFMDDSDGGAEAAISDEVPHRLLSAPISHAYTTEQLTWRSVWGRRGFVVHSGYWDQAGRSSCFPLLLDMLPLGGLGGMLRNRPPERSVAGAAVTEPSAAEAAMPERAVPAAGSRPAHRRGNRAAAYRRRGSRTAGVRAMASDRGSGCP